MTHNHAICNQWEFFSWMMLTPYTDLSPKCFNTLVEERAKDFATLCVGEGDLGSHSAHIKRSSNLASLCGITIPPPHCFYFFACWVEPWESEGKIFALWEGWGSVFRSCCIRIGC